MLKGRKGKKVVHVCRSKLQRSFFFFLLSFIRDPLKKVPRKLEILCGRIERTPGFDRENEKEIKKERDRKRKRKRCIEREETVWGCNVRHGECGCLLHNRKHFSLPGMEKESSSWTRMQSSCSSFGILPNATPSFFGTYHVLTQLFLVHIDHRWATGGPRASHSSRSYLYASVTWD